MPRAPGATIAALSARPNPVGNLVRGAGTLLVLDGAGERVLDASPELGVRIADAEGGVRSDLRRALRALATSLPRSDLPRLERLRLDGLFAPPRVCACLRAELDDGGDVLLVVPAAAALRSAPAWPNVPSHAAPSAPSVTSLPETQRLPGVRFLWRSDAEDRLVAVSSTLADRVRGGVLGRTWAELRADAIEDPAGRLAGALAQHETFRAVAVRWRIAGADSARPSFGVDLSATPLRAPDGTFAGFAGFGVIEVGATGSGELAGGTPAAEVPFAEQAGLSPAGSPEAPPGDVGSGLGAPATRAGSPAPLPRPESPPEVIAADSDAAKVDSPPVVTPLTHAEPPSAAEPAPRVGAVPGLAGFASLAGAAMAGFADMVGAASAFAWTAPRSAAPATAKAPELAASEAPIEPPAAEPPAAEPPAAPTPVASTVETALPAEAVPADPPPIADAPPTGAVAENPPESELSLTEHHAFREIARALGARFAGDETAPQDETAAGPDMRVGAVTPFRAVRPGERTERPERAGALALLPAEGGSGEAELRRLLDRLPIGLLIHRGEAALYANRALLDTVDYAEIPTLQAEGGVGRLFRGGDVGRPRRAIEGAAVALSTRSGATVPVEIRLTAIEWEGFPAGLMLVRRLPDADPAQRAAALELELAARTARLEALDATLATAADGVLTLDAGLRLTGLDGGAEALFGYDRREVAGESVDLLVAPEARAALHALLDAARTAGPGAPAAGETLGRGRGGARFPLDLRLARLPGPDAGLAAVVRDATPARAAADALAEARRALGAANDRQAAFLGRIGHGIRSPLNAILGFAEVMLEERFGPVGGERHRAYLRDIHAAGTRVVGLVDGLLDLARLEAGQGELAFGPVDLNAVASACVAAFQPRAVKARVVVRTSFAPGVPAILGDAPSLAQIAGNVVANAIQFTGAGGQVIVSTALTEAGEMALRVRDTGTGMNPEAVAAALDPFRIGDTTGSGPGGSSLGGSGLGLPLARALAAANRASLTVTSVEGEGTLVELVVPAARVMRG